MGTRLTAPNGSVVNVADDRVDALVALGYQPVKKQATKKAATSSKSSDDK